MALQAWARPVVVSAQQESQGSQGRLHVVARAVLAEMLVPAERLGRSAALGFQSLVRAGLVAATTSSALIACGEFGNVTPLYGAPGVGAASGGFGTAGVAGVAGAPARGGSGGLGGDARPRGTPRTLRRARVPVTRPGRAGGSDDVERAHRVRRVRKRDSAVWRSRRGRGQWWFRHSRSRRGRRGACTWWLGRCWR